MDLEDFWRNFNMNAELHISGNFIYNGLNQLGRANGLENHDEVFEILYNVSVGLERLAKVAIVLIDAGNYKTQGDFEKSLITHNHIKLFSRLEKQTTLKLSKHENSLLHCLAEFHKRFRYDRYILTSATDLEREIGDFQTFLTKSFGIKKEGKLLPFGAGNMDRIRKIIGRICKKICIQIYEIIKEKSRKLNLYTYDMRYGSKAYKIFCLKEYDFFHDDLIKKELILYLLKSKDNPILNKFLENLEPATFEESDVLEALDGDLNGLGNTMLREDLESFYEECGTVSARIEQIKYLGGKLNYFDIS